MLRIIEALLDYGVLPVLALPAVLKQFRLWHLGYLEIKSKETRQSNRH